jgi:hypothetical protein
LSQTVDLIAEIPDNFEVFFTMSQSISEVNFVGGSDFLADTETKIPRDPNLKIEGLAAVSARFPESYLEIPNMIFEIQKMLALKKVNLIEVISTATEINYIVEEKDTQIAISQLSKLL